MSENIIQHKSFEFSLKIIDVYEKLIVQKKQYTLGKQILRSGTSIGANIAEAEHGSSRLDFRNKLFIALKEAEETLYWIRLLKASGYIDKEDNDLLSNDCRELIKILTSILNTINKSA